MTYVEKAEERIKSLKVNKNGKPVLTTTQIRGLLSGISDIFNDVIRLKDDIIPQEIQKRILYLKVQFVYAAGRDTNVKDFIEKTGIIGEIDKAITSPLLGPLLFLPSLPSFPSLPSLFSPSLPSVFGASVFPPSSFFSLFFE